MAKSEKFAKRMGPGGVNCPCCTRAGKQHAKRSINRKARKNAKMALRDAYS